MYNIFKLCTFYHLHVYNIHIFTDSESLLQAPIKASDESHVCRPIDQSEALEVLWTTYPPEACKLNYLKISRWIRPIVDGKEAWSLLGGQENNV